MTIYAIIPARYGSARLEGKVLQDIAGKPMIQHVFDHAKESHVDEVIVATDDSRVERCVKSWGGRVCMTRKDHRSGTERIAEVISQLQISSHDIIVNVQGDEPLLPSGLINQVVENLQNHQEVVMTTLCESLDKKEDIFNLQINKVVTDIHQHAIYFSHIPVPWYRDGFLDNNKQLPEKFTYYRHIGIYAYHSKFVQTYVSWLPSPIEQIESLEQLRVLWYGEKIHVDIAQESSGFGVDVLEDLNRVRQFIIDSKNK